MRPNLPPQEAPLGGPERPWGRRWWFSRGVTSEMPRAAPKSFHRGPNVWDSEPLSVNRIEVLDRHREIGQAENQGGVPSDEPRPALEVSGFLRVTRGFLGGASWITSAICAPSRYNPKTSFARLGFFFAAFAEHLPVSLCFPVAYMRSKEIGARREREAKLHHQQPKETRTQSHSTTAPSAAL